MTPLWDGEHRKGTPPVTVLAERVLRKIITVDGITARRPEYIRAVIDQLGIRVSSVNQQSMAELAFDSELSAMVDRVARIVANGHWAEVRVHSSAAVNSRIECLTFK